MSARLAARNLTVVHPAPDGGDLPALGPVTFGIDAGQFVCLVPITALVLSALFMGEPLSPGVLMAVALIGAGIVTTMRAPR